MKKFFEKHDLFKLAGIFMLISVLLTWLCSMAYYQDGTLITDAITRAGVFDLVTYALLGMYYFTAMFIFIFVVSGFYKFLGTTDAYQKLTLNIADFFAKNGHEKVFVAISMLLFALLASVVNEFFVLFALIPFFISSNNSNLLLIIFPLTSIISIFPFFRRRASMPFYLIS